MTKKKDTLSSSTLPPSEISSSHPETSDSSGLVADSKSVLLKDYAYAAIQKHFKKSTKYRDSVLADTDPEDVHQMRVGMRRLRTALDVFGIAIALPADFSSTQVKKLAQALGTVRDLDVMQAELESYQRDASSSEFEILNQVLKQLHKQRQKNFKALTKVLTGEKFDRFERQFKAWLHQPQFEAIACLPIRQVLPDLLLPLISRLLLHPGWVVATRSLKSGYRRPLPELDSVQIHETLRQDSEVIHDLRKTMKRVRYQTEFFADFYGADYLAQTEGFRQVQELLGDLNDQAVLAEFLTQILGQDWSSQLPQLWQKFQQEQVQIWHAWQPIQAQYLQAKFRHHLRQLVSQPTQTPNREH